MKRDILLEGFLKVLEGHYKTSGGYLIGQWYRYKDKYGKKPVLKQKASKPGCLEEVVEYFKTLKIKDHHLNAIKFFHHYETNGWVQGKGKKIIDWKACVKTWDFDKEKSKIGSGINLSKYSSRND